MGMQRGMPIPLGFSQWTMQRLKMKKCWSINFEGDHRWWKNFVEDQKIGVHRINDIERKKLDEKPGEAEMLKGMCFWMKRELDVSAVHWGTYGGELREGGGYKKVEQWRSKRKGEGEESGYLNGKKEEKTGRSDAIDLENELQQVIKAAMA